MSTQPTRRYRETEKLAMEIVRAREKERGFVPDSVLGPKAQHLEGCDFFSTPRGGGEPHPVEVKGWGLPLIGDDATVTDPADITAEQLDRARRDDCWRLEIVGNLDAVRAVGEKPQFLTVTASEVRDRAKPWRFRIPLGDLAHRVETPN